jgi:hypothetical protein
MTFGSAGALAGLVLLVPLIALHLRDRGRPVREVPSLVVWQELELTPAPGERGLRLPPLPVLLLLQAAALALLVIALAEPRGTATTPAPARVIVLDDSLWMSAPGRLEQAERAVKRVAGSTGGAVRIVLADGAPGLLYNGRASGVSAALARVRPSAAPSDLAAAMTVAAGLLGGPRDRVTVIRAAEDSLPRYTAGAGELSAITIGRAIATRGILDASARCGVGGPDLCEVYATVTNSSTEPAVVHYTAQAAGHRALSLNVRVGARASAPIVLAATPGEEVSLRLAATPGALPADDTAWVAVPGEDDLPSASSVTLVGTPADASALARAFASVPGVSLTLVTPASYRPSDARKSDLVVLDDWLPNGALPSAPSVLLVDPPRLPGGHVGGTLSDVVLSGTDSANTLLEGVDLSSLDVARGAARDITLPRWLSPVVWSPAGPLVAAGDNGRQHVGVISFAPAESNLSQLASFPVLAANFVRWAAWAPDAATAGVPIAVDATPGARTATLGGAGGSVGRARFAGHPAALVAPKPGLYTISERGPSVTRHATVAVAAASPAPPSPAPVDLLTARVAASAGPRPSLVAWFLAIALAVLVLEWLYWSSRRRKPARWA